MNRRIVALVAAVTLASGAVNLYSLMGRAPSHKVAIVLRLLPLEFVHLSRFATLLVGFALVIASVNLWKGKKRAWQAVVLLTLVSLVFHLMKGLDYEEATVSLTLLILLVATRKSFTVRSSIPDLRWSLARLGLALAAALAYGSAGFWFLDPGDFGINFHIGAAIHQTVLFLTFQGDPAIVPHTRHARWFLQSLSVMTCATVGYSLFELFRPVIYRYATLPHERALAEAIVRKHGRAALDYFKCWHDKSYFFSETGRSFLAYKVGGRHAMALGDPVGPEEEIEEIVRGFEEECKENDWRVAFYQTLPYFLPVYRKLGFRKLKIGDDAIVDLTEFSLEGKRSKKLRTTLNQMEKQGVRLVKHEPPVAEETIAEARAVSDSWLGIPGRRERTFTLGLFEERYVQRTPLYAAVDAAGRMLAFVNEIPSPKAGEATLDLMRHRQDAPPGVMDYVFTKVLLDRKERGFRQFNFGMAPMSGFQEREESTIEERAVHNFMQRLNFLFNYQGLRYYKAKFATRWEPRYLVYRNVLTLPSVANAITEVSEIRD
jgi:phosphatidylglycerol lysyltransferase